MALTDTHHLGYRVEMKPADLALLRTPGTPTISPDGRHAAVAVTRLDLDADAYRSQLWLVATDGSAPARAVTRSWRDTAPRFSPDGRWLAFLRAEKDGKPQLHVLPVDGGEPWQVTSDDQHPLGAGEPLWSPDSRRVAYTARVPEDGRYGTKEGVTAEKEPPRRITVFKYRLDNVGFVLDRRPQVFVVDPFADPAEPTQITEGDYDHADVVWSPDGELLAFVSAQHDDRDTTLTNDVFVCAPDGSGLRCLTTGRLAARHPAFSPDGRTVYFAGADMGETRRDFFARNGGVWAVALDGASEPVRLTDEETYDLSPTPMLPTDEGVLCAVENRGAVELVRVPYDGGEPKALLDGPRQVVGFDGAAGVVVATVTDPTTTGELVVLRNGEEQVVSSFGAGLPAVRPMAELNATASDDYPVHGWVVRPEGNGPHPVLLMIHGGPFAQYGWRLFDEAQVYADAGYAVVMGNPRGSSGYGRQHGLAVRYDVGAVSATDLHALLDEALTAPDLASDRVGVLGGSHGGYMTTWLAGHTDRFVAAVSERAVNAADSFTGSSDIGWMFADQLYGTDPEHLAAQSPLSYAENISTPMLIIHSEQDWRCPLEQAQRLFVTLKKQGVETELLVFPGEGHELSRSGLPSHRVARFEAILDWWRRHL